MRAQNLPLWEARLACMFFFMAPGLAYGLFVSRVPALTIQVHATAEAFGVVLLCTGLSAVAGLVAASWFIRRFGAKNVLLIGSALALGAVCATAFAREVWELAAFVLFCGFGMGLLDVAMNVQGVEVERQYARPSMNLLHAGYNMGAVSGSLMGSLFAALGQGPMLNFIIPSAVFALTLIWATPRLQDPDAEHVPMDAPKASDDASNASRQETRQTHARSAVVPLFVYGWGVLAMISYVVEGASAEWGSLFLFKEKAAPESIAALIYGTYSVSALTCRLFADRLRLVIGDKRLMFVGSLVAVTGLFTMLAAPWWPLSLLGTAVLGMGLAPAVPLIFSHASTFKGVSIEKATSVIAMCAYAGLLAFPPVFGFLAQHLGLVMSLSVAELLLVVLAVSSFCLMRKHR